MVSKDQTCSVFFFLAGLEGTLMTATPWDGSGGGDPDEVSAVTDVITGSLPLARRTTRALCGGR